jgi:hypothetical protein
MSELDSYLDAVSRKARGPRADRLATELRDHVADAVADARDDGLGPEEADALVLERLGSPDDTLAAWQQYVRRSRARTRRRAATVALLASVASALAIVQLASGHRPDRDPCPPQHGATPAACEQPAAR